MQLQLVVLMILEYFIQTIPVKLGHEVAIEQTVFSNLYLYPAQMELQAVMQLV